MKYKYILSNRNAIEGDIAEKVIDDCIKKGLFCGDLCADWWDQKNQGSIRLRLRAISMLIDITECPRDEFCQFIEMLTRYIPDKTDDDSNEFYRMLLRVDENYHVE